MFSWRNVSALILIGALSACGGGGGGATSTGGSNSWVPTPVANNMGSQAVQRADVQSSIAGVQVARDEAGGNTTPFARQRAAMRSAMTRMVRVHDGRIAAVASAPGCSNGQTSSIVTNSNNTATLTVSQYYDSLCTEIEYTMVFTASASGSSLVGPLSLTLYSAAGATTETASGSGDFTFDSQNNLTGEQFLFTSISSGGKSVGELGIGCYVASGTSSCAVATAGNVAASSIEDGANVAFTSSTGGASFSMTASAYQAGIDGLTIGQGSYPDFTMAPASDRTGNIALSGTKSGSTFSITATDTVNGGAIAISGNVSGAMTGSVTRTDTNASVASFTLDANGNGTVTYSNSTTAPIANYVVQG